MTDSDVLPDNCQLEPCSNYLPDNGFLSSETDADTPNLPPDLEETDHDAFCHVDCDEDSSMPPIVDLATSGLQILAHIYGKPPKKSTVLSCKTIMKCFCVYVISLALLWLTRKSYLHS